MSKFDIDLDKLGDSQVLELNQNKNYDLEFNSILEKVTELSALSTVNCAAVDKMIKSVTKTSGRLALKKDTFFSKLQKIIAQCESSLQAFFTLLHPVKSFSMVRDVV